MFFDCCHFHADCNHASFVILVMFDCCRCFVAPIVTVNFGIVTVNCDCVKIIVTVNHGIVTVNLSIVTV